MSQLSIFEELDREEADRLATEAFERSKPVTCSHCGEESRNAYLDSTNHGIVFNGWCGKRLWLNSWAKPGTWAQEHKEQFETSTAWLAEHGWVACDEHDRANWPEGHIPYWEVKK
jgi:hypothetical protein